MQDDHLVLGLVVGGVARAYPHNIGWRHEIVNDEIAGHYVSVTFCPLTGTGLAFEVADRGHFELGVSGLLYNSNLIMWDRAVHLALPYWRQVDGRSLTCTLDPDVGFPFSLVDEETGSRWDILGVATEGPLAGATAWFKSPPTKNF